VSIPPSCDLEDDAAISSLQCSIGAGVDGNDSHAFRLAMVLGVRHRQCGTGSQCFE
jgi:hypothetical protein